MGRSMMPMPPWFWPFIVAASAMFFGMATMRLFLGVKPLTSILLVLAYGPVLAWAWRRFWRGAA
jgi:hypothetical protein